MDITTSLAICSSSPSTCCSPPQPRSSSLVSEVDRNARVSTAHHTSSKRVIGGLSALFAGWNAKQSSPCANDPQDLPCVSNSFARGTQSLSCSPCHSFDNWPEASSLGQSAISVLQGPAAYMNAPSCTKQQTNKLYLLDQQLGSPVLLCSFASDIYRAPFWRQDPGSALGPDLDADEPWSDYEEDSLDSSLKLQNILPSSEASKLLQVSLHVSTEDVLHDAQKRDEVFKDPFIIKAFREVEKVQHGQSDVMGDMSLAQFVETGLILAAVGASKEVVAAGLLHDTSTTQYNELQEMFGKEVVELVKGVSRMSGLCKLARDKDIASNTVEADRLHTMLLAMEGVLVVLIKLADRLNKMRTLGALPESEQWQIAKETLHIFTPLANRLGIWTWKSELEDLCFKHMKPQEYQDLARKLAGRFDDSTIKPCIHRLENSLLEEGILYHELRGRHKNLYGTYSKMIRKCRSLEEINDLRGLRLIVTDKDDCYSALHIVHKLWQQKPESIKDYIRQPKANGYQCLHTVVYADDGLPLEVQIRAKDMNYEAEFGGAAHWRYKEDNIEHSPYIVRLVAWARWTLAQQSEIMELKPLSEFSLRSACSFPNGEGRCLHPAIVQTAPQEKDDPVFIFVIEDNKGTVQEIPGGSTVADLLHGGFDDESCRARCSSAFRRCNDMQPRVNCKVVDSIDQMLRMGDHIELSPRVLNGSLIEYQKEKLKRTGDHIELSPRVLDGSLIEYQREKIKRMFGDTAAEEAQSSPL